MSDSWRTLPKTLRRPIMPPPLLLLRFRKKSAASASSKRGISPPQRPRKLRCASNSTPVLRRFSRRRNDLVLLRDQFRALRRLDRPAPVFSYRGTRPPKGGEGVKTAH